MLGPSAEPGIIREYAESTQTYVDEETARLVNLSYERVLTVLKKDRETLEKVAGRLGA